MYLLTKGKKGENPSQSRCRYSRNAFFSKNHINFARDRIGYYTPVCACFNAVYALHNGYFYYYFYLKEK